MRPAVAGDRVEVDDGDDAVAIAVVRDEVLDAEASERAGVAREEEDRVRSAAAAAAAPAASRTSAPARAARPFPTRCRSRRGWRRCCRGARRRRSAGSTGPGAPRAGSPARRCRGRGFSRENARDRAPGRTARAVARPSSPPVARPACRERGPGCCSRTARRSAARSRRRSPAAGSARGSGCGWKTVNAAISSGMPTSSHVPRYIRLLTGRSSDPGRARRRSLKGGWAAMRGNSRDGPGTISRGCRTLRPSSSSTTRTLSRSS